MLLTPVKFDVGYKVPRRSKGIQQPYASCTQAQIHPTLHLRRGLNLRQRLSDLETCLLPQLHDLESLEIGQSPSPLPLHTLLGPRALLPLRLDAGLLPLLVDNTSSCTAGQLLEDQRGEDELREGDRLSGNGALAVCGWSVDQSLSRVNTSFQKFPICPQVEPTRLWSMISTIAASLPSEGPPWMSAIRPTSTSLHLDT